MSPGHSVKTSTPRGHNARTARAKKIKGTFILIFFVWIQLPSWPGHDRRSLGFWDARRPRRRAPFVPGAWIRVRLARQVPRPSDDTWTSIPGLIAGVMRAPAFTTSSCVYFLLPGQTWGADPSGEERPAPGELVLPPSMHASVDGGEFLGAEVTWTVNLRTPFCWAAPLKPYLAAAVRHGALRYHQSTVASRSWRSAWKPQVSHNRWQRGIPDSTGYRMHIMRVPTIPKHFLSPDPIGSADP